jgi:O-antigen/teichoic acid export membrane protein
MAGPRSFTARLQATLDSRGLLTGAAQSLVTKLVALPVIAVVGILITRIVIDALGVSGYGIYALIVGLAALIPFIDLGVGAAVTDAVSRRDAMPEGHTEHVLRTSFRTLTALGVLISAVAWAMAALGVWAPLIGAPTSGEVEVACAAAITWFAMTLPLSLSARMLQGAERNHLAVAAQVLAGITALVVVLVARALDAPLWLFVSAPFLGALAVAVVTHQLAARVTGLSLIRLGWMPHAPTIIGAAPRIATVAGPMLIVALAEPVAWQADRLILSHWAGVEAVAIYALAFQLFAPLSSLAATSGQSLWPVFAKRRTHGPVERGEWWRTTVVFTTLGVGMGVALILLGPWLTRLMSKDAVDVPMSVFVAFAALLILFAAWLPSGMLLTDPRGLRVQAVLAAGQVACNIPLSILLAKEWGAVGPVVASAIVIGAWQTYGWWYAWRSTRPREGAPT